MFMDEFASSFFSIVSSPGRFDDSSVKAGMKRSIFASDRQRLIVLGMLLENLGIDRAIQFGKLEDWKAAIADLEKKQGSGNQP